MTEMTEQQIRAIYIENGFPDDTPTLTNVGFRNRVYIGEHAVLKVYPEDNRRGYQKEHWFYETAKLDGIPQLYAAGENWILMERIHGIGLFRLWRDLSVEAREGIIRQIAEITLAINGIDLSGTEAFLPHYSDYRSRVLYRINTLAQKLREIGGIREELLSRVLSYVQTHAHVLDGVQSVLIHYDLHFDNFLVTEEGKVVLIDFEMLEAAPMDMVLDVWQRMLIHPFTYANEDDHPHTHPKDYSNLLLWMQKYAPDLFSHPDVRRRVNLYGIRYELDLLCEYPMAAWPIERLERYLEENLW